VRTTAVALAVVCLLVVGHALAATVLYVYDELGRLVAEIDPSAETTTYTYDAAGNLLAVSRNSSSQFRVVAFEPTRGKAGDTVIVYGSGFVAAPGANTVTFNGTSATVTAATTNTLTVTVPDGASSGPLSVSNTNGSATTAQAFTVLLPAVVAIVTPSAVNRGATTRVVISGLQLATTRAINFTQGGLSARIVPPATDASVTMDLTVAGSVPLGDYPFSVTTDAGTSSGGGAVISVSAQLIGDVLSLTQPLSLHLPAIDPAAPAGNRLSAARSPVSVYLRAVDPAAPAGNALSAVPAAASVYLPAIDPAAPAGNALSVAQPASVKLQ